MEHIREILDNYNVTLRTKTMSGVNGMTVKTRSGYSVVINDQLSQEAQESTAMHELLHIILGHFDWRVDLTLEEKEKEVTAIVKKHREGNR